MNYRILFLSIFITTGSIQAQNIISEDGIMKDGILIPSFRLPYAHEWTYAAQWEPEHRVDHKSGYNYFNLNDSAWNDYAWPGNELKNKSDQYRANFGSIVDQNGITQKTNGEDGFAYTGRIQSYSPNSRGLYDMCGNVSEWTMNGPYVVPETGIEYTDDIAVAYRKMQTHIENDTNFLWERIL
ncbi:MAG: SUMF1/EgtB/PvdO family nonheme iron enzyme [Bacteroidetes bacterium]|nr:SUMF1/EgtB/PvdO family nonheme iron enzyme [Bacteroidota bacterium]MDA0943972.1 SUMF1/EgtB/PvdO family nonheme iron enzyme [Bacteroidota bacterium]